MVMDEETLQGLPLYVLGASSGGSFVQMLPKLMPNVKVRPQGEWHWMCSGG